MGSFAGLWPPHFGAIKQSDVLGRLATLLHALLAGAPEPAPTVGLQWHAPPACPEAAVVGAAIERLSGADVVELSAGDVEAEVWVRRTESGFAAEVRFSQDGVPITRSLHADDCSVLARASAVVIAVGLDPIRTTIEIDRPTIQDTAPPEPNAPPQRVAAPRSAEPSPPPSPPRRSRRLRYGGRIGIGAGGLVLPSVGPGFEAAAFVGIDEVHVQLHGQYWTPRSSGIAAGVGGSFQQASGGVRVCPRVGRGRWRFVGCAGVELGAILARGTGANVRSSSSATLWGALSLAPGFEVALTEHLSLWGSVGTAVSFNRPRFGFDGLGTVHQVGRFGPQGFLGLAFHNRRTIP